jgi:hypothetical protein
VVESEGFEVSSKQEVVEFLQSIIDEENIDFDCVEFIYELDKVLEGHNFLGSVETERNEDNNTLIILFFEGYVLGIDYQSDSYNGVYDLCINEHVAFKETIVLQSDSHTISGSRKYNFEELMVQTGIC